LVLAGLLTYFGNIAFPLYTVAKGWFLIKLTATGIVPDLHRSSLFIPKNSGTETGTKIEKGNEQVCKSYSWVV
jgi:hypothetical protein